MSGGRDGLRGAIHSDGEIADPRLSVLLALAHGTGMLAIHFDKRTLRSRKSRLERIAKGEFVAGATREAVQSGGTIARRCPSGTRRSTAGSG